MIDIEALHNCGVFLYHIMDTDSMDTGGMFLTE